LVDLIRGERVENSGLEDYVRNMIAVMDFDAGRKGRFVSQGELDRYTQALAKAVTKALHYFIGNTSRFPKAKRAT